MARQLQIPFAVDAKGEVLRLAIRAGPSLLKPNDEEAFRLLGHPCSTDNDAIQAVQEIRKMMLEAGAPSSAIAIISRGPRGAVMATRNGVWKGSSPEVEVHNTVGSGDSMLAAFLSALTRNCSPEAALRKGLAAGAATAKLKGSGLASSTDVLRLLPRAHTNEVNSISGLESNE